MDSIHAGRSARAAIVSALQPTARTTMATHEMLRLELIHLETRASLLGHINRTSRKHFKLHLL
jgi:hypothetical protein